MGQVHLQERCGLRNRCSLQVWKFEEGCSEQLFSGNLGIFLVSSLLTEGTTFSGLLLTDILMTFPFRISSIYPLNFPQSLNAPNSKYCHSLRNCVEGFNRKIWQEYRPVHNGQIFLPPLRGSVNRSGSPTPNPHPQC